MKDPMASFNRIILVGNLTRDPAVKYLSNQTPVTEFGLAVNHKYRTKTGEEREEVLFIDCTCFGKGGEVINQYCKKGRPLLVEGRLKFDTWEDKQGGGKRSKHSVMVENFQFMGGGRDEPAGEAARPAPATSRSGTVAAPASRPAASNGRPPKPPPAPQPFGDEQQFQEDDIPF